MQHEKPQILTNFYRGSCARQDEDNDKMTLH